MLQDQIISRDALELGTFRGKAVYSRSEVLQLKAEKNRRELETRAGAEGANGNGEVIQVCTRRGKQRYVPQPVIYVRFLFAQRTFLSSVFEDVLMCRL